jgi:AcrR family transcriptional regulator
MSKPSSRTYQKRRRAELEAETRDRIAAAAVQLHGSIGPARTTISAVAKTAGVQRATVYRHFPDDETLFAACTQLWLDQHPVPDLGGWAAISPPSERLRTALPELYAWFARTEQMLELITRDVSVMPSMRTSFEGVSVYFDAAAETLMRGRGERGAARRRTRAAVGHAIAFETWRSLVRRQRLEATAAVEMMVSLIER